MKYQNSDYSRERLRLHITPTNSREAYNKLTCLRELELYYNPTDDGFIVRPRSKRREALIKMFWAFTRMERRSATAGSN